MLRLIAHNWHLLVTRGVIAIAFGVVAWLWPNMTAGTLVLLFGSYALLSGVLTIATALSGASNQPSWRVIVEGLIGFGIGATAILQPAVTAIALLFVIAAWAITTGLFQMLAAIQLRREIAGEFWLALAGFVSVVFGLMLFAQPGVGALAVIWMLGLYAVVFGAALVALGFRVKGLKDRLVR